MEFKVSYCCSCPELDLEEKKITKTSLNSLYFCFKCLELRRNEHCVKIQNESYYCPSCFENLLSSDILTNKAKCKKCLLCPECLSSVQYYFNLEKFVYVMCSFCGWNSQHFEIKAQDVNDYLDKILQIEEQETQDKRNFQTLVDSLKDLNFEREKKKTLKTKKDLISNFSLLNLKSVSLEEIETKVEEKKKELDFFSKLEIKGDQKEEDEEKKIEFLKNNTEFPQETTLDQKNQGTFEKKKLIPHHRKAKTKKTKNCFKCNSILIKPKDIDPHSSLFEICNLGIKVIPRISVFGSKEENENIQIILKIVNPNPQTTLISFQNEKNEKKNEKLPKTTFIWGKEEKEKKNIEEFKDENNPTLLQRINNIIFVKLLIFKTEKDLNNNNHQSNNFNDIPIKIKTQNLKTKEKIFFTIFISKQ